MKKSPKFPGPVPKQPALFLMQNLSRCIPNAPEDSTKTCYERILTANIIHTDLYMIVHSSSIHNSHKVETT